MARVTYGESITEYAGSIGGVTFLRNASGPIAKLRSNPPVNPSPDQSAYQNIMAILVAHWPTLSQENKKDWNDLAAVRKHTTPLGVEKTLSGYQWFLSCNLIRYAVFRTITDAPVAWVAPSPPPSFTLVATAEHLQCEWSPEYDPVYFNRFFLSLPLRQSSLKLRRSLFHVYDRALITPFSSFDLTSYFEALANVSWASFYASANCSIICRVIESYIWAGYSSAFTSAIVKIG